MGNYQKFMATYSIFKFVSREFIVSNLSQNQMFNIISNYYPEINLGDLREQGYGTIVYITCEIFNS